MKKIVTVLVIMLFSLTMIFGQEEIQIQNQTQTQAQNQTQVSEDPLQYQNQERIRINDGRGTMTRAEKRQMRKENHGAIVSKSSRNALSDPNKGEIVIDVAKQKSIQQQDRDRTNFKNQTKSQIHKPTNFGKPMGARPMHQARSAISPGGGRK